MSENLVKRKPNLPEDLVWLVLTSLQFSSSVLLMEVAEHMKPHQLSPVGFYMIKPKHLWLYIERIIP